MNLNLTRPIAFFDLETTGVDVSKDRIVEISIQKLMPNGDKETFTKRVNPEIPIPIEASEVHGIYDFDVLNEKTWKEVAPEAVAFFGDADLAGYNSNRFDIPMLMEELLRVEVDMDMTDRKRIDVQNIFHKMEQRTLIAAYRFYCNKDLTAAHSAQADTLATYEVLEAQIEKYAQDTLDSGRVIPGYGHAVLRQPDPRFTAQRGFAERNIPDDELVQVIWKIFDVVPPLLEKLGKVKNPWPNVDAHSGALLVHYGMTERNYYTVLFGVSRALGVMAALCWARALGQPLERPKSVTSEWVKKQIADKDKA